MRMIYEYKCLDCEHIEEVDLDPNEEKPQHIPCTRCCIGSMVRVFGNASVHVPFQWTKDTFDFTKRPRSIRKYR